MDSAPHWDGDVSSYAERVYNEALQRVPYYVTQERLGRAKSILAASVHRLSTDMAAAILVEGGFAQCFNWLDPREGLLTFRYASPLQVCAMAACLASVVVRDDTGTVQDDTADSWYTVPNEVYERALRSVADNARDLGVVDTAGALGEGGLWDCIVFDDAAYGAIHFSFTELQACTAAAILAAALEGTRYAPEAAVPVELVTE